MILLKDASSIHPVWLVYPMWLAFILSARRDTIASPKLVAVIPCWHNVLRIRVIFGSETLLSTSYASNY